jgi:uncharacterized membrane protein
MRQTIMTANARTSNLRGRTGGWRDLVPPVWLIVLILAYSTIFGALSIRKHNTFHSDAMDLGIMTQVIWNTAHGRPFEVSLDRWQDSELVGSYLGNHVRPIFLLIAPLYRLWPDPRLLLILQSAALGLAALPLWWVARREIHDPRLRVAVVVSYLLYPALAYLNLYDFHPIAFSIPLLFLAYWALLEERDLVFWAAIVLSLATKEELVVPVAAFGIYCLFRPKTRKHGISLLLLAAVWAFVSFVVIIPRYNEGRPYRFLARWSHLTSALPAIGGTSNDQLGSGVEPLRFYAGAVFVLHLFLPLAFTPLLNPGLLAVSLPSLAYLLLSNEPGFYSVGFQYSAVLIPWLYLAVIQGLAWLERRPTQGTRFRAETLALVCLLVGIIVGELVFAPVRKHWQHGLFSPIPHRADLEAAMTQIPPQASVATIYSLGTHLAHRRSLLLIEHYPAGIPQERLQQIEYVLLDLVDCTTADVFLEDADRRATYTEMVKALLATGEYGVQFWSDRILLLRRGAPVGAEIEQVGAYVDRLQAENRWCYP